MKIYKSEYKGHDTLVLKTDDGKQTVTIGRRKLAVIFTACNQEKSKKVISEFISGKKVELENYDDIRNAEQKAKKKEKLAKLQAELKEMA